MKQDTSPKLIIVCGAVATLVAALVGQHARPSAWTFTTAAVAMKLPAAE